MTTILINAAAGPLLDVAAKVLTRPDLPDTALIGGLAVTISVAAHTTSYRATGDVDLVTGDDTPTLVELLTWDQDSTEPVVIDDKNGWRMIDCIHLTPPLSRCGGAG